MCFFFVWLGCLLWLTDLQNILLSFLIPSVTLNVSKFVISPLLKSRYRLTYEETDSRTQKNEEFDYVVLAFPIHEESVMKADPEIAQVLPKARPYMEVDFTHFHGDLSSAMFSLPEGKDNRFPFDHIGSHNMKKVVLIAGDK